MTIVNYDWDEDEDNIVEEYDDTGNTVAEYTTEPGLYGDLLSQRRNGEDSYCHYDGQGSTAALTNSAGDVTDTYEYSAFGEVTAQTGSTVNPFQYTGRKGYYRNSSTGEYEIRRRCLDVGSGRWLSYDPIKLAQAELRELLQYAYAHNSPVQSIDPSGLLAIIMKELDKKVSADCLAAGQYKSKFLAKGIPATLDEPGALAVYEITLDKAAPCNGSLIAKVAVTCSVSDCIACKCPEGASSSYFYVEALGGIAIGKTQTTFNLREREHVNDVARTTFKADQCQAYKQEFEVRFYCKPGPSVAGEKLGDLMEADAKGIDEINADLTAGGNEKRWKEKRKHGDGRCGADVAVGSMPPNTYPRWWNKDKNNGAATPGTRLFDVKGDCCAGKGDIKSTIRDSGGGK
jgi:RHS repeat-associated protein